MANKIWKYNKTSYEVYQTYMHFIMMTLGKGASLTDAFPGLIKFSQLRNKKRAW